MSVDPRHSASALAFREIPLMQALEVMRRQVVTVTDEASINEAVRLMIGGILCQSDPVRRIELGTEAKVPAWLASIGSYQPQHE